MKRYFAALCLVLILSVGLIAGTALTLHARRDDVELTQNVLYGDPSDARGIQAGLGLRQWLSYNYMDMTWRCSVSLGEQGTRTSFAYRQTIMRYTAPEPRYLGGANPSVTDLHELIEDVASRTGEGETRTELLRLADYYEYFPWELSYIDFRGHYLPYGETAPGLADMFRLPMDPELLVRVRATVDGGYDLGFDGEAVLAGRAGDVTDPDAPVEDSQPGESVRDTLPQNTGPDCVGEAGLWFCPSVVRDGEELIEYRDGPGVYFVPAARDSDTDHGRLEPEKIRKLLDLDAPPLAIELNADASALWVYHDDNGRLKMLVLDPLTGELRQELDLMDMDPGGGMSTVVRGDLTLVILNLSQRAAIIRETEGVCQLLMVADLTMPDLTGTDLEGRDISITANMVRGGDMAWDGRRLVLGMGVELTRTERQSRNDAVGLVLTLEDGAVTSVAELINNVTADAFAREGSHLDYSDVTLTVDIAE